jgi:DNA modification methylase
VIFDPFSGVGSTGYQAIKMGRKFIGSELKQSYFDQACKNIASAKSNQHGLFGEPV